MSLGADTTRVSPSTPMTSTAEYSARCVALSVRTTLGHAATRSSVGEDAVTGGCETDVGDGGDDGVGDGVRDGAPDDGRVAPEV